MQKRAFEPYSRSVRLIVACPAPTAKLLSTLRAHLLQKPVENVRTSPLGRTSPFLGGRGKVRIFSAQPTASASSSKPPPCGITDLRALDFDQ
jgi:hypothetical protein